MRIYLELRKGFVRFLKLALLLLLQIRQHFTASVDVLKVSQVGLNPRSSASVLKCDLNDISFFSPSKQRANKNVSEQSLSPLLSAAQCHEPTLRSL